MFKAISVQGFFLLSLLLTGFDLSAKEHAGSSLSISVRGNYLTASIKKASLAEIVNALNNQNSQTFVITGVVLNYKESPLISAELKRVPLMQGLQRLLKDQDYVLFCNEEKYFAGKTGVFLKTRNQFIQTSMPRESGRHETKALDERSVVLEQLADLSDLAQLESVLPTAVQDPDRIIREHALKSLTLMFDDAPRHLLEDMALFDPLPELRAETLEVLADRRENWAIDILHEATADADPSVSQLASTLLDRISLLSEE